MSPGGARSPRLNTKAVGHSIAATPTPTTATQRASAGTFDPACRTIEDFVADYDNLGGCTAVAVPAQDENDLHVDGKPSAIAAPGWRDQANEMGGMP